MKLKAAINRFLIANLPVQEAISSPDKNSFEVRVPRSDASTLIRPGTCCELEEEHMARKLVVRDVRLLSNAVHIYCAGRVS